METNERPLWAVLRSLALIAERRMRPVIVHAGLTVPQYQALRAFAQREGVTSADAARTCHVTPQTAAQTTRALEAKGLLKRTYIPGQGRLLPGTVTPLGFELLREVEAIVAPLEAELEREAAGAFSGLALELLLKLAPSAEEEE